MTHPLTPREKVAELIYDRLGMGSENSSVEQVSADIVAALASGSGDHAELARLAEDLRGPWLSRIKQNKAADALGALLAEIAALRASASVIEPELGDLQATNADLSARLTEAERKLAEEEAEVQRWKSAYDITHEQATENGSAANALRGKLAEAVRLLRRIDCIYADMQDGNGNHPTELRKVRTFLIKEAERG